MLLTQRCYLAFISRRKVSLKISVGVNYAQSFKIVADVKKSKYLLLVVISLSQN